ncbi:MAG: GC-type dockerin domain-anchored protein [Planctomycetota bacterium]
MKSNTPVCLALALLAGSAQGQIEPILYTDGIIPGVIDPSGVPETIWQTGLYRVANSPDRSRWALRVNHTSANDNEYIVSGSGTTGSVVVHSSGSPATVPADSVPVFYISERELSINDSGLLAVGGSFDSRATTDTAWLIEPGVGATIVALEASTAFTRPTPTLIDYGINPNLPDPLLFNSLSVGDISNTGKVMVIDTDIDQALIWDAGSYSLVLEDDDAITDPPLPGDVLTQLFSTGTNLNRSTAWFFEEPGEDPIIGVFGAVNLPEDGNSNGLTDELSSDVSTLLVRDAATGSFSPFGFLGATIDGRSISEGLTGWIDEQGNEYITGIGGFFFDPTDGFGIINGEVVADIGGDVGGTVPGETWILAGSGGRGPSIFGLDRRADGAYIVAGVTSNPATVPGGTVDGEPQDPIPANRVIMFVAADGTRTELVRSGDDVSVVLPDGSTQDRKIALLNQLDATYSMYIDDSHLYFLAGTTPFAGTIPSDLFARIELPGAGDCLPDTNGDGELTPGDFNAWVLAFNGQLPACDQNGDGLCTPGDFNAWILNFNNGCG